MLLPVAVIVVVIFVGISSLFTDLCGNRIDTQIVSPDKELKAVVFTRDCGATTSYSTQISVLNSGDTLPNEAGNVFIIDSGSARVYWKNAQTLKIEYSDTSRVFKNESSYVVPSLNFSNWKKVKVEYSTFQ